MFINEVRDRLFNGIYQKLIAHGFKLVKRENAFERKVNNITQTIYFIVYKKNEEIFVEPRWSVKIKSILDIYAKVSVKEKKYIKDISVLDNSIFQLMEYIDENNETGSSKSQKYVISEGKDIDILINVIPIRVEEYILPYFKENSSVERVDILLNSNPQQLVIHNWLYPLRAIMGVIAAKLAHNPKFDELLHLYEEKIKDASPEYKSEFEHLKLIIGRSIESN
jgi:hypothetical protein